MGIGELSYKKTILVMLTGILLLSLGVSSASPDSQPLQMESNTLGGINSVDSNPADYSSNSSLAAGASPALPGVATLYSPSGVIITGSPTYIWYDVPSAVFYKLLVNDSSNKVVFSQWFKETELAPDASSRIRVTPSFTLKPGDYKWRILTWDPDGPVPSNEMAFEVCTSKTFPGRATLVSPRGSIGTTKPVYIWNPVAGATRYRLKVANVNDISNPVIDIWYNATDVITDQGAVVKPNVALTPGSYRWWIQTGNCLGDGPWSFLLSFTVTAKVPSRPSPISPRGLISTRTPTFVWTAVPGATEYNLYIENETGIIYNDTYPAEDVTQGYRCYLLSPIILPTDDIDFFWQVQAANDVGTGLNSTLVWFEVVCGGEKTGKNSAK